MENNIENIDIIVPVYNEEEIIDQFYQRVKALSLSMNLIFIDNHSEDNTIGKLQKYNDITLIQHHKNEGYGGSLIHGIEKSSGDIIVIIDADCEYPPEAIPRIVSALETSDVVYGSRFLGSGKLKMPKMRIVGNKIISLLFNLFFDQKVTDLYTGFKALRRTQLTNIHLLKKGFVHVLELSVKLSQNGAKIMEIPIDYQPRFTGRSKMSHVKETLIFFLTLFSYKFFKKKSENNIGSNE